MSGIYVQIVGVEETRAALEELVATKIPRAIQKAESQGAKVFRAAIQDEASSSFKGESRTDPGGLLRSISYRSNPGGGYVIGPQGKGSQHRSLIIRGHDVKRVKGGPVVGHAPANPFVARGEERARDEALAAVAGALREVILAAGG